MADLQHEFFRTDPFDCQFAGLIGRLTGLEGETVSNTPRAFDCTPGSFPERHYMLNLNYCNIYL